MDKNYIIRIYDTDLIKFNARLNELGQMEFIIVDIDVTKEKLLPPRLIEMGIDKWLKCRVIPKNREYVHKILESIGSINHPVHIVDISLGL